MSVAIHEASHVAAAIWLGRPVTYVRREAGNTWRDEVLGGTHIPLDEGRFHASDLVIRLIGYWSERRWRGWPPPFEKARTEEIEDLDLIIRDLGLDRVQYERLVGVTERMLTTPSFVQLRDAFARALSHVPHLEAEDIAALSQAHGFSVPTQEQELTCSV